MRAGERCMMELGNANFSEGLNIKHLGSWVSVGALSKEFLSTLASRMKCTATEPRLVLSEFSSQYRQMDSVKLSCGLLPPSSNSQQRAPQDSTNLNTQYSINSELLMLFLHPICQLLPNFNSWRLLLGNVALQCTLLCISCSTRFVPKIIGI